MKNLVFAALASVSVSGFAQSYFILDNGLTLTTDSAGYVYDYGHYTSISRMSIRGGQFIVEDSNILVTVDERGFPFRKYEVLPTTIKGKGTNYIIGDNNAVYVIDQKGNVHLTENDPAVAAATKFGGSFFVVENDLYTVSISGSYQKVAIEGLKPQDILTFGGNYFMTNRGVLFTISADGKVFSRAQDRVGIIVKRGGNYFIDSMGFFYVVTADGSLKLPSIPMSLRLQAITKLGVNYFIDANGKLFTVDKDGNVLERMMNYDLKTAKIISM